MTPGAKRGLRTVLAIVAITMVGAGLRFSLAGIGLWRDEAYTYFDITRPTFSDTIEQIARGEWNPPLFFLLERDAGQILGFSDTSLKVLSLLCGVALVPVTFRLAMAVTSYRGALLATAFVATAEVAIYYSQEVRPYALGALLLALVINGYVRWLVTPRPAAWPSWLIWAVLLEYTHYVGIVAMAGLLVATLFAPRPARPPLARLALFVAVLGAALSPWMPFLVQQLSSGTPWTTAPPWSVRPGAVLIMMASTLPGYLRANAFGFAPAFVAFAIVASEALILHSRLRTRQMKSARDLGGFVIAFVVLWVVVCEAALGYYDQRYVVLVLAPAMVVYALFLDELVSWCVRRFGGPPRVEALIVVSIALVIASTSVAPTLQLARVPKSGMRAAGRMLATEPLRSAAILVGPDIAAASCAFYNPGRTIHGFARWNDPQLFSIADEKAAWTAPDSVERTLRAIDSLAAGGAPRLAFVRPTTLSLGFGQAGILPFQATDELVARLGRRYRLIEGFDFPGNVERASIMVYDLRVPANGAR